MIIISGDSEHVVVDRYLFQSIQEVEEATVKFAIGSKIKPKYWGKVSARLAKLYLVLSSVYYILVLEMNTLYCSNLDENGITTIISRNMCTLIDKKDSNRRIGKIARGA